MGVFNELSIEPWTFHKFLSQKQTIKKVNSTWGKDEHLERFGTSIKNINFHAKPIRFFSLEKQLDLYFNWLPSVRDRRTRRIITAHRFPFDREITEERYKELLNSKTEKIVSTIVERGLRFNIKEIPLTHPFYDSAFFSFEDEELDNYHFWIASRDKERIKFAKEYGQIIEINRYFVKDKGMNHKYYTLAQMKKYAVSDYIKINEDSYYCTSMTYQNVVKKDFKRSGDRVTEFCLLFAEIDYYKLEKYKDVSQKKMLEMIYEKLDEHGFPRPTEVVFPGGLHLVWKINPIPAYRYWEWSILQLKIYEILKDFNVDKQTMTNKVQLLRLAGTIHTRTGKKIWGKSYTDDRYLFDELLDKFCLEEVEKEKEKRKKNREKYVKQMEKRFSVIDGKGKEPKGNKVIIQGEYDKENKSDQQVSSIIFTRYIRDLFKLVELRNGKMEGYREFLCFLVRWFSLVIHQGDTYKAEQDMKKMFWALDINEKYDFEELLGLTSNVHKVYEKFLTNWRKGYMYKAVTLQEHFEITKKEQEYMITLIDDENRSQRKREGDTALKRKKRNSVANEELRNEIIKVTYENPNMKSYKIAQIVKEKLGKCSKNTVEKVWEEINN